MSAHTPGPFKQVKHNGGVCIVCPLHAAAPEMLEALERIANIAECVAVNEAQVKMFDWDNVVTDARATIAKAKGESK